MASSSRFFPPCQECYCARLSLFENPLQQRLIHKVSQCRGEPVPQELQDRLWESSKRCFCWWRSFRIRSTEGITLSNGSSRRQYLDGANIIPKLNCSSPLTFLRRPLKLLRKKWNLWMIGARPVADGRGIVNRVEPVILEELGRRGLML
ncbi:uncharacterized protein LOC108851730 isoform X2 [Raphanus sativus]|uniref:Uncharacterized protein LOC108851730 isoform X2 n=1 Tax=Raphanus sativus TaxID=3726 RepID=A0A6J0NA39_RAPSA|nr:uncharacterized protein LOC108851730 isoform X2 [Raphanus sativus]XP_018480694.1 uncharacterized protein LOC108851730 isoform X2 [Raphanus sativus]